MIDVHAHITSRNFDEKLLQKILTSAKEAGVQHIISVSETIDDANDVMTLATQSDGMIWPSLGLHPVQYTTTGERSVTMDDWNSFQPILEKAIQDKSVVCIGEIGLDFSKHILQQNANNVTQDEPTLRQIQSDIFKAQVELAIKHGLPINVHSRSAGHYALSILYDCGATLIELYQESRRKRVLFSIPPSIIRSPQKETLAKTIPITALLLESDSPALGPEKGQDNEPKNIKISAEEIARIKSVSVETVVDHTTQNALRLFKKHQPSANM
ncbi:hypothetical protein BCR42DRAFT_392874 [Absidia repens]|uniref:TatD family n=1 Tax=Absidia repens TaxID=90262 RepID=A0A1X2IG85_9FUNG|nr:hypothetical protein BCR42DRAFT_392874 [Absidia repens]